MSRDPQQLTVIGFCDSSSFASGFVCCAARVLFFVRDSTPLVRALIPARPRTTRTNRPTAPARTANPISVSALQAVKVRPAPFAAPLLGCY